MQGPGILKNFAPSAARTISHFPRVIGARPARYVSTCLSNCYVAAWPAQIVLVCPRHTPTDKRPRGRSLPRTVKIRLNMRDPRGLRRQTRSGSRSPLLSAKRKGPEPGVTPDSLGLISSVRNKSTTRYRPRQPVGPISTSLFVALRRLSTPRCPSHVARSAECVPSVSQVRPCVSHLDRVLTHARAGSVRLAASTPPSSPHPHFRPTHNGKALAAGG